MTKKRADNPPKKEDAPKPDPDAEATDAADEDEEATRIGRFIQKYSGFLSSFVIGAAGLIATSIWQYKQSEIARRQADSQQKIAETNAENQWRIERAEILSKNLSVLATHGGATVDQRYGVLLSLTRGNIMDPELAVSYALELGKDNPEYMKSVLSSTDNKNYAQLAHAFALTCEQRYGLAREVELCKSDHFSDRSDQIARLVGDELDASTTQRPGPLALLRDERTVQKEPSRYAWLFMPWLTQAYQTRRWEDLRRFESYSPGAHLIESLVMAVSRTGELTVSAESAELETFHSEQRRWLAAYLFSKSCDGECKGHILEFMLTNFAEAQGDYDDELKRILQRPRTEVGPAVGRLHARLIRCQVDPVDLAPFRDRVLVPALAEALAMAKPDPGVIDDITDLLALVPAPLDPPALAAWNGAVGKLQKAHPERYRRGFVERRASANRERRNPPPLLKKLSFCNAADLPAEVMPTTE